MAFAFSRTLVQSRVGNTSSCVASEQPQKLSVLSDGSRLVSFGSRRHYVALSAKRPSRRPDRFQVRATEEQEVTLSEVVFQPFQEVKGQIEKIPTTNTESFARQRYSPSCEAAINEQINVEYNVSYIYHALSAYFNRDNVALPGFAKYFKDASDEEREHAEKLMDYQSMRGGRVKLASISAPISEFDHPEKGDALYAMELALSLEKLNNEKLLHLHKVASECDDAQLCEFIEGSFLGEQVEDIKKVSEYVAQLRRIGKGHGVYHFDLQLQGEAA